MSTLSTVIDFVGGAGLLAGLGAIFGLGRLHQKVTSQKDLLDRLIEDHKSSASSHAAMAISLGRVEERIEGVREDLREIKDAVRGKPQ